MNRAGIIILLITLLFSGKILTAQEAVEDESLNFTYIGPALSFGYTRAEYRDWNKTLIRTKKMSGYDLSGGMVLDIFAGDLCGDFQLKYVYNALDFAVTYLDFSIACKYYYPLNNYVSAGGGLGLYCDMPPSNRKYNGSAGLQLPVSVVINASQSAKMFTDIYARYGSFGIGQNTKSFEAGFNAGFIFKVGRI